MAILSPYSSQILINGVAVQEYDDDSEPVPDGPVPTVVKYIEVTSGAEFSVKFSLLEKWHLKDDLVWQISLDGSHVSGRVKTREELSTGDYSSTIQGLQEGSGINGYLRKFRFADIVTGEVANCLSPEETNSKYSQLGVITVRIRRYKMFYSRPVEDSVGDVRSKMRDLGTVPEKALKGQALSLSTSLGVPERSRGSAQCVGEYLDKEPMAVFEFRYRSRAALQQLMIIPRSPTPLPLEERPIESLTAEEARELLRRQRARAENTASNLKSETKKALKRDRSSTTNDIKPAKIARTADGREYIDLSSDSEDESVKPDRIAPGKDSKDSKKKKDAKIEVIDLLD